MPVLMAILAVLGALAVWWWRIRMAAEASREALDVADDVRAAFRRFGYRRGAGQHPSDNVDDPRLAAAGVLHAIARLSGDVTAEQIEAIRRECREAFEVGSAEADDIVAYGRWLSTQSQDPDDAIRRLVKRIHALAPPEAHRDLIDRMERIGGVGGAPNPLQADAIERVRRTLTPR